MDKKQRDELVSKNMGYVVTLARQYSSELLSTDDLISEGSIGMIKAAEKYDPSRGKPFVTFAAPYIRHSIEDAIRKVTGEVPVLSTDESLPVGSKNNYTLLNVLKTRTLLRLTKLLSRMRYRTIWCVPSISSTRGNRLLSAASTVWTRSVRPWLKWVLPWD